MLPLCGKYPQGFPVCTGHWNWDSLFLSSLLDYSPTGADGVVEGQIRLCPEGIPFQIEDPYRGRLFTEDSLPWDLPACPPQRLTNSPRVEGRRHRSPQALYIPYVSRELSYLLSSG